MFIRPSEPEYFCPGSSSSSQHREFMLNILPRNSVTADQIQDRLIYNFIEHVPGKQNILGIELGNEYWDLDITHLTAIETIVLPTSRVLYYVYYTRFC